VITYQLLAHHKVTNLTLPARDRRRQLSIVLARAGRVSCALAHLELDKEFPRHLRTDRQHLFTVNLHVTKNEHSKEDIRG
jgi:hypothetical protein